MTPSTAGLRALLANAIDYAGLFPPASLTLAQALHNQSEYVRSADAAMLGAFVLPVAQFDAIEPALERFDEAHPLRISALGAKTDSANAFLEQLAEIVVVIRRLCAKHAPRVSVEQLEIPLPPAVDEALLGRAEASLNSLSMKSFLEAPAAMAVQVIATIAAHRLSGGTFGFKLRTGGTTAAAFPSTAQVAEILVAGAFNDVPMKFTAGLHHPIRHFDASVDTKMHGFLNVLGAGMLTREEDWDVPQTATMLADEDPSAFCFSDSGFSWRSWAVALDQMEAHRTFITSFGSCSFDEPREDLRALNML